MADEYLPRQGQANRQREHCARGHPFDAANTYHDTRGHRRCRACDKLRKADPAEREKERNWRKWKAENDPEWLEKKRAQWREAARRRRAKSG